MSEGDRYLRTDFLERISHELKGPIGVTLGVLDELEASLPGDPARSQQLLAMARRSARRLLGIAERLQRTSLLEQGDMEWRLERAVPKQLVERALTRAREIDARRGLELTIEDGGDGSMVEVDTTWVVMALSELVLNALRNARTRIVLEISCSEGMAHLAVVDDGAGFPGPVAPRFRPATRPQGLGLSLCLIQDVASAHGGSLTIDAPAAGSGARVTLHLPLVARTQT